MKNCSNIPVKFNNFTITQQGENFVARQGHITIVFMAEGRNGGLYFNPKSYSDGKKVYKAQRYLYKCISLVGGFAMYLADNDYLWDYPASRPFLESRNQAYHQVNEERKALGKPPLYREKP